MAIFVMMKNAVTMFFVLLVISVNAHANLALDSIPFNDVKNFQLFIAPGYSVTQLSATNASFVEFQAGLIYKKRVEFALRYASNIDNFQKQLIFPTIHYYDQSNIGLRAQYSFFKKSVRLHTGVGYQFVESSWSPEEESQEKYVDYIGLAELYVGLHRMINKTFTLQGDLGYQLANDVDLVGFEASDFGGFEALIMIKIAFMKF